jgi:hypothetical protein
MFGVTVNKLSKSVLPSTELVTSSGGRVQVSSSAVANLSAAKAIETLVVEFLEPPASIQLAEGATKSITRIVLKSNREFVSVKNLSRKDPVKISLPTPNMDFSVNASASRTKQQTNLGTFTVMCVQPDQVVNVEACDGPAFSYKCANAAHLNTDLQTLACPPVLKSAECVFWDVDAEKWANVGVDTMVDRATGSVTCQSTHLTDFAIRHVDTVNDQTMPEPEPLPVATPSPARNFTTDEEPTIAAPSPAHTNKTALQETVDVLVQTLTLGGISVGDLKGMEKEKGLASAIAASLSISEKYITIVSIEVKETRRVRRSRELLATGVVVVYEVTDDGSFDLSTVQARMVTIAIGASKQTFIDALAIVVGKDASKLTLTAEAPKLLSREKVATPSSAPAHVDTDSDSSEDAVNEIGDLGVTIVTIVGAAGVVILFAECYYMKLHKTGCFREKPPPSAGNRVLIELSDAYGVKDEIFEQTMAETAAAAFGQARAPSQETTTNNPMHAQANAQPNPQSNV